MALEAVTDRVQRLLDYPHNLWTCPFVNTSTPRGRSEMLLAIRMRSIPLPKQIISAPDSAAIARRRPRTVRRYAPRRHADYVFTFGKYAGQRIDAIPETYLRWCVRESAYARQGREDLRDALVARGYLGQLRQVPPPLDATSAATANTRVCDRMASASMVYRQMPRPLVQPKRPAPPPLTPLLQRGRKRTRGGEQTILDILNKQK
jgi:hypothetical protein